MSHSTLTPDRTSLEGQAHPHPPGRVPARAPVVVGVARGGSDVAVRAGAREARRTGRPLDLVHVAPVAGGWDNLLGRDSLRVATERARSIGGEVLTVEADLRHGSVLPVLVDAARSSALLVVERRRAADLRRSETSTAACLADACDVPILVVPAEWLENTRGVVTVGLDPDQTDDSTLQDAMARARLGRAALRVLVAATVELGGRDVRSEVDARLARLGGDACDLAVEMVRGPAGAALLSASATSDLVVLGRHTPLFPAGSRLGQVATQVLREAGCPVLLGTPTDVLPPGPR
jgi:nucleotide-binding universal stress UspA family protein